MNRKSDVPVVREEEESEDLCIGDPILPKENGGTIYAYGPNTPEFMGIDRWNVKTCKDQKALDDSDILVDAPE